MEQTKTTSQDEAQAKYNQPSQGQQQTIQRAPKIWIPLESNPHLYTKYAAKLGFQTDQYRFYDVFSMDAEVWQNFIPQPVLAVILLYQVNRDGDLLYPNNSYFTSEKDRVDQPFFVKQTIGNACGTVSLLHALCNTGLRESSSNFEKDSFLDKYVSTFRNSTPQERADFLYEDVSVEQNHQHIAESSEAKLQKPEPLNTSQQQQQSQENQDPSEMLYCHYVTFIEKNGNLWQLDGRIPTPLNKGPLSVPGDLGLSTSAVIQQYMRGYCGKGEIKNLSIMALAPNIPEELLG
ncbi:hypothetical protein FGO68_gene15102 [Halteria grandinella]|uniref:Ubiquitin carboxyl-terminal hydrolase n=1 Tax=Halteria grandinella TaxID=5974 RepID=A0A8J8NK12_HALGN|nr:hypothetical protein FGO68_gene15102 [Halteria grandinella]